ncbi:MAG: hypothetical protein HC831_10315 [Chloroflexia bacterium]|nr:hypothetical protein [Chloroflexia bacterium]
MYDLQAFVFFVNQFELNYFSENENRINPHYSYDFRIMNVNAGNPDLDEPNFGYQNWLRILVAITDRENSMNFLGYVMYAPDVPIPPDPVLTIFPLKLSVKDFLVIKRQYNTPGQKLSYPITGGNKTITGDFVGNMDLQQGFININGEFGSITYFKWANFYFLYWKFIIISIFTSHFKEPPVILTIPYLGLIDEAIIMSFLLFLLAISTFFIFVSVFSYS